MSIPANQIVNINPGVITSGGNPLSLNGLFLTQNLLMPTNRVLSFASTLAVKAFFGPASAEYAISLIYFAGFDNSTVKPNAILFAPFNLAARSAWLQSGSLAGMTQTQLDALTGLLTLTVDGVAYTSSAIVLTGLSFSAAATAIAAAFAGTPLTCVWDSVQSVFILTSVTTGSASGMTFATGTLSAGIKLTSATGATLSQGDTLDTEASAMTKAVAQSQNWASFSTLWEPILASKELFATWSSEQNSRYLYVGWDSDTQASVGGSTECFGYVALQNQYNGVCVVSGDPAILALPIIPAGTTLAELALNLTAFVMGAIASVNFSQVNGRVTLAFLSQSGLLPTCGSQVTASNLLANGYSFYGSYATANQGFLFFNNGQMPGEWSWIDTFINQVYLNSQFQLVLMDLATQVGSVPYDEAGYGLIRAALLGPITAAISFGAIRSGVVLSPAQVAELNSAAGVNAASIVQTQGWYLQILDPGATARGLRQSPIINFWYTDGGAVQLLSMGSFDIL